MRIGKSALLGAVGFTLAAFGTTAVAQEAAKVLEQRQALMKAQGGNMKALGEIAKGERTEAPQEIAKRAQTLREDAKQIAVMFKPEFHVGNVSGDMKTTASEKIWAEPEKFTAAANNLELASAKLEEAANSGDQEQIKVAIGGVGKTCGGCHELYRVKKQ